MLVPSLKPKQKCIEIPREVCVTVKEPRNIKQHIRKLQCWEGDNPTPEEIDPEEIKERLEIGD